MTENPVQLAALAYAARGFRVLPLDGKVAFTARGSHGATTDTPIIERWFETYPFANVGIATGPDSGLWVLDADGEEGKKSLAKLDLTTETPWVATGGGGIHVYFAWDDRVGQKVKFLPGLDTRARGGYVVAPPSRNKKSGALYRWIHEHPTLAKAPESVIALVSRVDRAPSGPPRAQPPGGLTPYGKAALDGAYRELSSAEKGCRDDRRNITAFSLGRLWAGGHASRQDVIECVIAATSNSGLLSDLGEAECRKRTERAVDDGYAAGPRGPVAT